MPEQFVQSARLVAGAGQDRSGHPWDLPAVAQLSDGIALGPTVTYLIGENGSGKSTLLAGIAVAAGMNPEGGSSNFSFPLELMRTIPMRSPAVARTPRWRNRSG